MKYYEIVLRYSEHVTGLFNDPNYKGFERNIAIYNDLDAARRGISKIIGPLESCKVEDIMPPATNHYSGLSSYVPGYTKGTFKKRIPDGHTLAFKRIYYIQETFDPCFNNIPKIIINKPYIFGIPESDPMTEKVRQLIQYYQEKQPHYDDDIRATWCE